MTLATVYSNGSAGASLTQPLIPHAGSQTTLTTATGTGDTTCIVADVTGWSVGQVCAFDNGTNHAEKVITAINSGTRTFTLDSAIGTAFAIGNTTVGGTDQKGFIVFWVDDAQDYYARTKDVASGRVSVPTLVPVRTATMAIQVMEEGTNLANTRTNVNFIGASVTAVDNAGSNRSDVTITGLQADGSVGAPSIGFTADTNTGLYRIGADDMAITTGGHINLEFLDVASAVNYLRLQNAGTTASPTLTALGTDTNIQIDIVPKGTFGVALRGPAYLGTNATDYIGGTGGTGTTALTAQGGSAAVSMNLVSKGAGTVQINGVDAGIKNTTASADLGADVTLVTAGTWYDGPSVSLTAGTWLVIAGVDLAPNGAVSVAATARLWDGTTTYASGDWSTPGSIAGHVTLAAIVAPGSTTSYKVSATPSGSTNLAYMKAAAVTSPVGNNATFIRAVKLF